MPAEPPTCHVDRSAQCGPHAHVPVAGWVVVPAACVGAARVAHGTHGDMSELPPYCLPTHCVTAAIHPEIACFDTRWCMACVYWVTVIVPSGAHWGHTIRVNHPTQRPAAPITQPPNKPAPIWGRGEGAVRGPATPHTTPRPPQPAGTVSHLTSH